MMRDLYNTLPLPDDRPITAVCVVEELAGCPTDYTAVSKTHDQDIDADLYKDGFFRRVTRYLCYSKIVGYRGYVVENITIVNDRDSRPPGYTIVEQTIDTSQKAFKKKQLCYKQVPRNMASRTITDIIIMSHSKVAPEGFTLVGEMNGLCVCFKPGPAPTPEYKPPSAQATPNLPYTMNPNGGGYLGGDGSGPAPRLPTRKPPPLPSQPEASPSHATLYSTGQSSLFGVPFVLNKKYVNNDSDSDFLPVFTKKSRQQIEDEYYYSFTLEQDIVQRPSAT